MGKRDRVRGKHPASIPTPQSEGRPGGDGGDLVGRAIRDDDGRAALEHLEHVVHGFTEWHSRVQQVPDEVGDHLAVRLRQELDMREIPRP